ncbi:DNA/RNA helicase domain-containing protein [Demequina sp. SO4-13]|uniref:DNA/RNA helicase domain-containing protein n=1 Tax=Demequina sp. SO4-13 TaxID=3401027 RepID=UPI003AF49E52
MTDRPNPTRIHELEFSRASIDAWRDDTQRHRNWPVVYTLNNKSSIYVGESLNAVGRIRQHLDSAEKRGLRAVRIVVDDTFNKSVCLDLESFLIRMFSGDGRYQVLNRNDGVTNADYYERLRYNETFRDIFGQLREAGLFDKKIPEIENSDLFKLSPFKALNKDQEAVVEDIVEGLFSDLEAVRPSTAVIEGGPGTGKTIVAIYLLKLLVDIRHGTDTDNPDVESVFSDFFQPGHAELLQGARIGLVIPQQSLRKSVKRVFERTPGLSQDMVLTPYDVAKSDRWYDLLIVDESHRLTQYGAQAMGTLTKAYREHSQRLARDGESWEDLTQIDWIVRSSKHQVFLVDEGQSVRPMDVSRGSLAKLRAVASTDQRGYRLVSQMRVQAGQDYVAYVRDVLSDVPPAGPRAFESYDLKFFDNLPLMRAELSKREQESGLARLVAGYAWPWKSKGVDSASEVFDIELDGVRLCWNRSATDWINTQGSVDEVGSIHTVQGYDLNYAGVIIGADLRYDPGSKRIELDRNNYFDKKGKANNALRAITTSDADVLAMVRNIYGVLLTRGMKGTYVYVVDPALREHLRPYFDYAEPPGGPTDDSK